MKRVFKLEFDDFIEASWVTEDYLVSCLSSESYASNIKFIIKEITDNKTKEISRSN